MLTPAQISNEIWGFDIKRLTPEEKADDDLHKRCVEERLLRSQGEDIHTDFSVATASTTRRAIAGGVPSGEYATRSHGRTLPFRFPRLCDHVNAPLRLPV